MGELRIGNRERELAMAALDEHLREGRLEPGEYAERSAVASTARVRSELDALFADLPAPHPAYPGTRPVPDDGSPGPGGPVTVDPAPPREDLPELVAPIGARLGRHAGVLSALAPVLAVVLFVVTGLRFPQVFLLVPVMIGVLAYLGHKHGG
ncbi:DUF1707 SHOCT-like domain-containing protein [Actinomycetospora termitidis]|uniref:DUF1707 domain-containing protein n=1 Tax=Actinomycetospora termitidis TaxID=3053470 RepID=A0ABT7MHX9_9PSEU|nr:DUF1707 domain-containing protein [Actinomycetospora sp. Odt1-22]MDL5160284.1 DUF1707 domain-containing protein [Actinomycetospora sp. Odt1-22]